MMHVSALCTCHCPIALLQATDLAAGSQFGYDLLSVVLMSSITAMFLQYLSLKLGVAAERDLAQVRGYGGLCRSVPGFCLCHLQDD